MKECKATRVVCAVLWEQNALVFAVVASAMQEPGWPDRYIAHRKWSGWLEFKTTSGRLSTKQRIVLRSLADRGVPAYVIRVDDQDLIIEDAEGTRLAVTDAHYLLDALKGL